MLTSVPQVNHHLTDLRTSGKTGNTYDHMMYHLLSGILRSMAYECTDISITTM